MYRRPASNIAGAVRRIHSMCYRVAYVLLSPCRFSPPVWGGYAGLIFPPLIIFFSLCGLLRCNVSTPLARRRGTASTWRNDVWSWSNGERGRRAHRKRDISAPSSGHRAARRTSYVALLRHRSELFQSYAAPMCLPAWGDYVCLISIADPFMQTCSDTMYRRRASGVVFV